jgi:hypothetical protein
MIKPLPSLNRRSIRAEIMELFGFFEVGAVIIA